MREQDPIHILLVEDNLDHLELITRILSSKNRISLARDGREALDFLSKDNSPKPQLIVLDLKLPKMDGFEVLKHLKGNPKLQSIPVVILTTSSREEDIKKMYALGANSYVIKPDEYSAFMDRVQGIEKYWTVINTLPRE